ncbi:cytochrome o ubiquinol oxidase subunit IV [Sphingomonas bacterium]|uniref:cytochrome o ubiquinol oxidase subunit IV n=1 Tax=Sphingomonas bacterium TaxID=1895847 RepID=UPI0015777007|nr:cytochrome o ubiquinol oxidase subunit IV [Sphingomonas bacterium]
MTEHTDVAPGDKNERSARRSILVYLVGLAAATGLTIASFAVADGYGGIWSEGVPVALMALAVGQMGVHLVFFLHVTTGPDNTNNVLALAFGTLIVGLVMVGSLWIMAHVNHQNMSTAAMARMQR